MNRFGKLEFRSPLGEAIQRFITHKRALNRRFDTEERALHLFDRHLVEQCVVDLAGVTPDLLEAFLAGRPRTRPRSYNHLLGVLRRLFDWMVEQGILDISPVRVRPRRETACRIPYIFDLPQACRLVEVAAGLPDNARATLRGPTYATIFALLYGLGLRVGEVARLTRADVDLDRQLLVVRQTKFAKTRLVPFGPRMAARIGAFIGRREQSTGPLLPDRPVFSFSAGRPVHPGTISQTFHALVPRLRLDVRPGVAPPRLHDLRHSFAVGTLLRWYRSGAYPAARLIHLSTFLGHVDPASTAVYLTLTAELLEAAGYRFGRFAAPLSTGRTPW
ncbi:MAG: tyrosine-type recombinase/integrase [Candidatus Krumholzibacteriia bacterium]